MDSTFGGVIGRVLPFVSNVIRGDRFSRRGDWIRRARIQRVPTATGCKAQEHRIETWVRGLMRPLTKYEMDQQEEQ